MTKRIYTSLLCAFFLAPVSCAASSINIAFSQAIQTGVPGSTLIYSANLLNNTAAAIDLGAANVTLGGLFAVDTTPFLSGPATLAASGSTGLFEIFTVTIPAMAGGLQTGVLSITDINDTVLGVASFTVVAAPEPSTAVLLAGAFLTGFLCYRLRARKQQAQ